MIFWCVYFRFDPVYFGHFKCNLKSIEHSYPNILKWTRRIYQKPGGKLPTNSLLLRNHLYLNCRIVNETVNMEHIKGHYYKSHRQINPTQIVPVSNGPDLNAPIED